MMGEQTSTMLAHAFRTPCAGNCKELAGDSGLSTLNLACSQT